MPAGMVPHVSCKHAIVNIACMLTDHVELFDSWSTGKRLLVEEHILFLCCGRLLAQAGQTLTEHASFQEVAVGVESQPLCPCHVPKRPLLFAGPRMNAHRRPLPRKCLNNVRLNIGLKDTITSLEPHSHASLSWHHR